MEINFKAFIFDMDGTLVDSFLDFDSMREELNFPKGVPLLEYIESMGERITQEQRKRYFDIIHKHELEGAQKSVLMDGCREFLDFLKRRGIFTAVLTRNSLPVTELTFERNNISFDMVLTRDCIKNQKPDPEGLYLICDRLKVSPKECAYMGDFLFDLEAAKNAGMRAVLYSPENNLTLEKEADYIVRSYPMLQKNFEAKFLRNLNFLA